MMKASSSAASPGARVRPPTALPALLAILLLLLAMYGCSAICTLCKLPDPTPTPTPTPPPEKPIPPEELQCHLMQPPQTHECFDNPPNGESFEEWQPNWGYVCPVTDSTGTFIRKGKPADCPDAPGPGPGPGPEPPPSDCGFPQGVDDQLEKRTHTNRFRDVINPIMEDLSGCSAGSDCPIPWNRDEWNNMVIERLCAAGLVAGLHREPGAAQPSDQISVNDKPWCETQHTNQQIFSGEFSAGKVRWSSTNNHDDWAFKADAAYCAGTPPEPPSGVCMEPNPRGLPARFVMERIGNGNKITSTYQISQRSYCDQVCSPTEPNVCYTGRHNCPVRMEGDPERVPCERQPDVVGQQQWWCGGVKIEPEDNPAQARCASTPVRTCTEDGATCGEID